MGAIAVFDYLVWVARYPEFAAINQPTVEAYFNEATIYWRNDGSGYVQKESVQLMLLNMVVAHIATINSALSDNGQANGQPGSANGLVGRISSASEGSVSVSSEYSSAAAGTEAWFIQTKYGAAFWQASAAYRTMVPFFRRRRAVAWPYGWPGILR